MGKPGHNDLIVAQLQKLLADVATRKPNKQAIIAVESGGRSFRWIGTKGQIDPNGAMVCEDTPFFLASIDKLYNATIAMMLNESGQLDLDDSISIFLPNSITRGLHQYGGIDYSDRITVRHLLSHTSGLADWLEDYSKTGSRLIDKIIKQGDLSLTINDLADLVREQLKPHFPPQDLSVKHPKVRYSDTNYMLIIAIIEAVTGEPLYQVHEQLLYKPMDLRHTYFPGLSQPLDTTSEPMSLRARGEPLHIPLLLCSIRGIYSTAKDTLTYLRRFMRGDMFQYPGTLVSMQNNWHKFGFPMDRAALHTPGWPIEYGLGIMRFRLPRLLTPLHSMPTVLGHTGSTGCWLFYCPGLDLFLSGSVDEVTAGTIPYRVVPKLLSILGSSYR